MNKLIQELHNEGIWGDDRNPYDIAAEIVNVVAEHKMNYAQVVYTLGCVLEIIADQPVVFDHLQLFD